MHFTKLLLALLPATFQLTEASPSYTARIQAVNTTSGEVHGFEPVLGVHAYLGIPYAAPPLGSLRFMPAQPVPYSEKPIHATAYGPSCMQYTYKSVFSKVAGPAEPQSEDCLTVNIWVPAGHNRKYKEVGKRKGLPAMVWIYGGGFAQGTSASEVTTGENIVKAHPDIIVASFNYRLNIFGFPSSPALPQRNLGLLDTRFAIEWLHANLAAFGGDPAKITLFGESAGAASISSYTYTYVDKPLVRAFIMQSGTADFIGYSDDSEFKRVSNAVGCGGGNSDEDRVRCFQQVDAVKIQRAISNMTFNFYDSKNGGVPAVDNRTVWTLAEHYRRGFEGKFAKLPTLIGDNHHEGDSLVPFHEDRGINYTLSDFVTKAVFTCPSAGNSMFRFNNSVPTYRYRYMAHLPSQTPYSWIREGFHSAEVGPVFGVLDLGLSKPQRWEWEISAYIMNAWVTFAKDPADGLKHRLGWPQYNPGGNTLVEMFPKNKVGVEFVPAGRYDEGCDIPPRLPL